LKNHLFGKGRSIFDLLILDGFKFNRYVAHFAHHTTIKLQEK
jgi:hypothetical protein